MATLPGIQKASLAMPDIHWGYGFCIGGVAATDPEEGGVISPGGVGYDINCGVRLLRSNLEWSDVKDRIRPLVDQLFRDIPTGVGQSGRYVFDKPKLTRLMDRGRVVRRRTWGMGRSATCSSPRPAAASTAPTRAGSATGRSPAATTSAARSARATTSSKSRSSTACSIRSRPR